MKKWLLMLMLLIGVVGFSAGGSYETSLMQRMNPIETRAKRDLESGVTADMKNATYTLFEAWDLELNKVYKLVMGKLSKAEKEKLRNEQIRWVRNKEKKAKEASEEFEGGTYESLIYNQVSYVETKEKTIELARRYDKINK